jgi:hypothetical protein
VPISAAARQGETDVPTHHRTVAVGEADGPRAGMAALAQLDPALPHHFPWAQTTVSLASDACLYLQILRVS